MNTMTTRTLSEIAFDALACDSLKGDARLYSEAYLKPMTQIDSIHDSFGMDSGHYIVIYALSNLRSWRGDDARRIKAELKEHLSGVK